MTKAQWNEWNRQLWIAWMMRDAKKDKRSFLQYRKEMETRVRVA